MDVGILSGDEQKWVNFSHANYSYLVYIVQWYTKFLSLLPMEHKTSNLQKHTISYIM